MGTYDRLKPANTAPSGSLAVLQKGPARRTDCCALPQTFYALFATLAARRRGGMLWRKVQPCEPSESSFPQTIATNKSREHAA
jgi:hypothetical protein